MEVLAWDRAAGGHSRTAAFSSTPRCLPAPVRLHAQLQPGLCSVGPARLHHWHWETQREGGGKAPLASQGWLLAAAVPGSNLIPFPQGAAAAKENPCPGGLSPSSMGHPLSEYRGTSQVAPTSPVTESRPKGTFPISSGASLPQSRVLICPLPHIARSRNSSFFPWPPGLGEATAC